MIAEVDQSGTGEVEYEEFLEMMTKLILGKEPEDEEDAGASSKSRGKGKSKAKQGQPKREVRKREQEDDHPGEQLLRFAEDGNLEKAKNLVSRYDNSQMP